MSNKSVFRRPFDKQHWKRTEALLKSACQYLDYIHWLYSLITANSIELEKVSYWHAKPWDCLSTECLPMRSILFLTIPIQMQLSQKQESFPQLFSAFLKSTLNFEYFEKKMTVRAFVFPKLGTPQTWLDKRVKSLVWEDSLISNMVNVLKHWWNLHHSTFIIFIDHC